MEPVQLQSKLQFDFTRGSCYRNTWSGPTTLSNGSKPVLTFRSDPQHRHNRKSAPQALQARFETTHTPVKALSSSASHHSGSSASDLSAATAAVSLSSPTRVGGKTPSAVSPSSPTDSVYPTGNQCVASTRHQRIQELFDWLFEQPWARQYFPEGDTIKIAISGISSNDARKQLVDADFGDLLPMCSLISPNPGKYTSTADELKPGSLIGSSCMSAVYSGSISGCRLRETGITVDHAFSAPTPADVDSRVYTYMLNKPIGRRVLGIGVDTLLMDPSRKNSTITADVSFLAFDYRSVSTTNDVTLIQDGRKKRFSIKLHKTDPQEGADVVVVDQNGHERRGKLQCVNYNNKENHLYRTLTITNGNSRITDVGDSGALVMCNSQDATDTLNVLGIVIGKWESDNGETTSTIANRLWDVLQAVGKNKDYCELLSDKTYRETGDVTSDVDFAEEIRV